MTYRLGYILFFFLFLFFPEQAQSAEPRHKTKTKKEHRCNLRVASFNLLFERNPPEQTDRQWINRRNRVLRIFHSYRLDIIGTQEALSYQINDLLADGDFDRVGGDLPRGEKSTGRAENEAIFYRKARFEVLEEGNFWFSETPDKPGSHSWGTTYPRMCSYGKFRDKKSGCIFYVFNAHFHVDNETSRMEAAKILLSKIKSVSKTYPVFCTGDLNGIDSTPPIQYLLNDGTMTDSRIVSPSISGPTGTYHGFNIKESPKYRIDYILTNDKINVKSYRVADDDMKGNGFASDHLPVIITASLIN